MKNKLKVKWHKSIKKKIFLWEKKQKVFQTRNNAVVQSFSYVYHFVYLRKSNNIYKLVFTDRGVRDPKNSIEPIIQTNPNRKKTDFYGSDQKPTRTNWKPKWFGSVLGSNFQIQWINRTKPIYSIYVKLFF